MRKRKKYGFLVFLRTSAEKGNQFWDVRCRCGTLKTVRAGNVRSGRTTSCGCYQKAAAAEARRRHGMSGTPTYSSWHTMHRRCEKHLDYVSRGITVCRRWADFVNFFADMGVRPVGTTLERKNNNKGYTPANCVWATPLVQNSNTRHNRVLCFRGLRMCASAWARHVGLPPKTLRGRLYRGWSVEDALTRPLGDRK